MQESSNNIAPKATPSKSVSIGALLVNGRNAAALNQADVAEQINLPISTIKALEQDDFERLPEATYVRGYLRNYSRAVGIEENGVLRIYNEQYHQEPEVEPVKPSRQSYDPAILWSTAAVMSILAGLVITWWFDNNKVAAPDVELVEIQAAETSTDTAENDTPASVHENSETSNNRTEDIVVESTTKTESSDVEIAATDAIATQSNDEITPDQQQAMEDESRNPNLLSAVEGASTITVTYMEKSWTEIRDADANTLMQGLIEPGVVRDLRGKPPFEVFLGNAPGVVIEVNGLYFDHSQYSRSNRTARFQVSSGSFN